MIQETVISETIIDRYLKELLGSVENDAITGSLLLSGKK